MMTDKAQFETPIDEIYRIRQEISASYGHDPKIFFQAMREKQREDVRNGQVVWGYNAAGELAPLQSEAICGAMA